MDQNTKKEIYDQWLLLENSEDSQIRVKEVFPGKILSLHPLSSEKMIELDRYRKWVLRYCGDFLDEGQKWDLNSYISNPIKCTCETKDCAKCLLINCQDGDCYFHPKDYKEDFKRRYNNK